MILLVNLNMLHSLERSLIASLKGCKVPQSPTFSGPFRICLKPIIFRSNKVLKATLKRTPKVSKIMCKHNKIILIYSY